MVGPGLVVERPVVGSVGQDVSVGGHTGLRVGRGSSSFSAPPPAFPEGGGFVCPRVVLLRAAVMHVVVGQDGEVQLPHGWLHLARPHKEGEGVVAGRGGGVASRGDPSRPVLEREVVAERLLDGHAALYNVPEGERRQDLRGVVQVIGHLCFQDVRGQNTLGSLWRQRHRCVMLNEMYGFIS